MLITNTRLSLCCRYFLKKLRSQNSLNNIPIQTLLNITAILLIAAVLLASPSKDIELSCNIVIRMFYIILILTYFTTKSAKNAWHHQLKLLNRHSRYKNYLKRYTKYLSLTQKTPLHLPNTFARYVQSLYSFHSAAELVKPFFNHPHYKPSQIARPL